MPKEGIYFTAGQFAQLHQINKRTLHYYDDIGLFSPAHKGENGYRYYTYAQSAELENILSLRELGMSIDEIKAYLKRPNAQAFRQIAAAKTEEIDSQIKRLGQLKAILRAKEDALALCAQVTDGQITVTHLPQRYLLLTPLAFKQSALTDMAQVMAHLQTAWAYSDYKSGCGSYIALDKIRRGQYDDYDGLFTPVAHPPSGVDCLTLPAGACLCGYCIGDWGKLPCLYQRMLAYAAEQGLALAGFCYESGLNEFAIADASEYITQVVIACANQ